MAPREAVGISLLRLQRPGAGDPVIDKTETDFPAALQATV